MRKTILLIALIALPGGAYAQSAAEPFTGFHAGPAIGAVDHHFVLEESTSGGPIRQFNVTRWGIGGEGFAGYDLAVTQKIVVGAEAAFDFGGRSAIESNRDYTFGIVPRHGFSLSVRPGYKAGSRVLLYAGGGFGGHDYRVVDSASSAADSDMTHTRSFILRGGAEYAFSRRGRVRFEFQHLDGTRNLFMLGFPFRF
ncbi:outer membrane protein [Sphingomonas sp. GB1N7]|uniref:outer membrane protein n=1 Tax=Parasphingomonas caseinilytica TaxID=3096158 RepID=UPI002FC73134